MVEPRKTTTRRAPAKKTAAAVATTAPAVRKAPAKKAAGVPAPRTPGEVTAEMVWKACPPMGKPAAPTSAIAEALGIAGPWGPGRARVLDLLNRLAAQGRAQRLIRDRQPGELWWRRQ